MINNVVPGIDRMLQSYLSKSCQDIQDLLSQMPLIYIGLLLGFI